MKLIVVLVALGVPLAAYLAYRSWQQEQKRKELLLQWATSNGWTFTEEDDSWCGRWNGAPFGLGDHRRARDVIAGAAGTRTFVAFDYSYQTHSSDGKGNTTTTTHRYVVTAVRMPTALPDLQVTPESVFSRIGHVLGMSDIELESEDFNRRFRVHGPDPKFASDVLSPRTMQALLGCGDVSWRINGTDIIGWYDGKLDPTGVQSTMATLGTVIDGVPSFVWHDHGLDPTTAQGEHA
ncbi:MAG: hypothetical protein QOF18_1150 [Frankiaceae bacterium]|nr:hypothetical protein [Frankiaceae bacterium]